MQTTCRPDADRTVPSDKCHGQNPKNVALTLPKASLAQFVLSTRTCALLVKLSCAGGTACKDREVLDITAQTVDSASPTAGLGDSETLDLMEQLLLVDGAVVAKGTERGLVTNPGFPPSSSVETPGTLHANKVHTREPATTPKTLHHHSPRRPHPGAFAGPGLRRGCPSPEVLIRCAFLYECVSFDDVL